MKQKNSSPSLATTAGAQWVAIGAAIGAHISFSLVHSIPWAIFHAWLGWFYVLYRWYLGF